MTIAPSSRSRRLLRWLVAIPLLLLTLHGAVWWLGTGRMAAEAEQWAAARRAEGWQISYAPPRRAGWPLAFSVVLPKWQLTAPTAIQPPGLTWQADALTISLAAADWRHLRASAEGPQRVLLGERDWEFTAEDLSASYPWRDGQEALPALRLRQLRLDTPGRPLVLAAGEAALAGRRLDMTLHGVTLPAGAPFGGTIQDANIEVLLEGPLSPSEVLAAPPSRWRDAAAALDIRRLDLRWGALVARAQGRLALDAALQPAGEGRLNVADPAAAAEALGQAGLLTPQATAWARGLLPLLARPDPAGGPPRIELPLTLRDRTLAVSGIGLVRLPPLFRED
ncbi:DUF2125 domain-containing protein [Pseudoroseomonas globiformis]|uniref:DUF2125 domain-containing protein n=1 Tax=Teichococcus globiformis TaxID=2307229 RepID=A0ABV7FWH6_9PROT